MRVAVVGAGWAGCAAAVEAARRGHQVLLLEASRQLGGRARRLEIEHGGQSWVLDNGQHILIGAYGDTLGLMRQIGLQPDDMLLRLPLALRTPDGQGLALPGGWPAQWAPQLAVLAGVLGARGWSWRDKLSLLRQARAWQSAGFVCADSLSVADLCQGLSAKVVRTLIEPLCISALNTPIERASASVFLRVMKDALFAQAGGSDLLLPRTDLSALLPDAAAAWLRARGHEVRLGQRITQLQARDPGWSLHSDKEGVAADAVILACPAWDAARLLQPLAGCAAWLQAAQGLAHESITTVYAHAPARLARPMLALTSDAKSPAQFVFDRGQLGGPAGLLAFVVSASQGPREQIESQVLAQARAQLGLQDIVALATVVEKRATFACTPGLQRPGLAPQPGQTRLLACGDHTEGPYPATLEGAVRSGLAAARAL
jgi:squalene-associated FAD-dependent desaturase